MNARLLFQTFPFVILLFALLALPAEISGQNPQLSLADLLVGLKSKKVPLNDRNKILAEAVQQRGITFSLTPEIEKELSATGADNSLIGTIKAKSPVSPPRPAPEPVKPAATPTPPDFVFYKSRAEVAAGKGDFTGALADYGKALELKPDSAPTFVSRGQTYFSMKSFGLSVADFNKAVDLNPKDSMTYFNRGAAQEKLGEKKKAMVDYQKAVELEPTNESAKISLKRLQDEEAKLVAKVEPVPPPKAPEPVEIAPEFVDLGTVTGANAVRMVRPVYPQLAQRSNIEGRVVVAIEVDEIGNVTKAKATSGHQMLRMAAEAAAQRSKFKPGAFDGRPNKAKAVVIYNFSLQATRE
ncbi:MAG: TonB family protein [Acidobacteria bacterium]|nr:TonB family protein [Acidobacteriota bacterium]MCA1607845.1 TonB family protein [Acidobacteriota bacterium]